MSTVDVIIPVYRPDQKLEQLIGILNRQTVSPEHIFFMQTMTGEIAEDFRVESSLKRAKNAQIIKVHKLEFDHGGTRNQGAAMSQADYMLFMTQDAVPQDERLIEELLRTMEPRESIATAYGRQLPNDEVGAIERFTRDFNYPDEPRIKSKKDLDELGIKTYFCSNVCAMYRRELYLQLGGFVQKAIFNEDMIFAGELIQKGYGVAYVAEAKVVHSHNYSAIQQFHRNFDLAVSQADHPEVFAGIQSEGEGIRLVKKTAGWLCRQGKPWMVIQLVWQSGWKYLGYLLGKRYQKLPKWVIPRCTMNPKYWE